MIIDSHVHVWVQKPEKYPWSPIGGYVPSNDAPVEELMKIMELNNVGGAVLVQPTPYGWDNRYLLDAVNTDNNKFRSVCLVDPLSPQNAEKMYSLVTEENASGFRLNWNLHPLDVWTENTNHFSFWETASELKTPVCIQCTLDFVPLLKLMHSRFPQVRVVIDHLGRLNTRDGITNINFKQLLSLSHEPNIYIKISGFYYCSTQSLPYTDLDPFLHEILNSFGVQRCLWGSDFPFIKEHWDYSKFLEFIKKTEFCSETDLEWILGKTAWNLWWKLPDEVQVNSLK